MSMKSPLTLAGIEPATFRFVAQLLNHFLYQNTHKILEIQYVWADALHLEKYPQFLWP